MASKKKYKYCKDCGQKLSVDAKYCISCGEQQVNGPEDNSSISRNEHASISTNGKAHTSTPSRIVGVLEMIIAIFPIGAFSSAISSHTSTMWIAVLLSCMSLVVYVRGLRRLLCYTHLSWDDKYVYYRQSWFDIVRKKIEYSNIEYVKISHYSEEMNCGTITIGVHDHGWRQLDFIDHPDLVEQALLRNIEKYKKEKDEMRVMGHEVYEKRHDNNCAHDKKDTDGERLVRISLPEDKPDSRVLKREQYENKIKKKALRKAYQSKNMRVNEDGLFCCARCGGLIPSSETGKCPSCGEKLI